MTVHKGKSGLQPLPRFTVQFLDPLPQFVNSSHQIIVLFKNAAQLFLKLIGFLFGAQVNRAYQVTVAYSLIFISFESVQRRQIVTIQSGLGTKLFRG